ncbi:MAG: septum formation initiator family protein [Flavobacteriales bacterium]|uniref:FtsB family cell division protein n=1 Tax=Sanyastnella coralliicola TaxID=3069118 RepID=UPI0027BA01FF|nr:septum formation initiator family protein [Longitalea sp. SCSIO 12813]MCH2198081.1 septum formation initiator family protein [Flavobacteriales bacterium]
MKNFRIPKWLKNKYVLTPVVFAVWMLFFNDVDLFFIMNSRQELNEMKREAEYLKAETERTREALHDLNTNSETLEKFAREEYFMKKPNEDLYIVTEK